MRVGLIGAMDAEVAVLKDRMEEPREDAIASYRFTTGRIHDTEVVLLQSGIGKVNAAISTSLLNQVFKPDCVINTGSAGGFDRSLSVGDLVIATEVGYHDVDVTAFDYEYGQVPGLPRFFPADSQLVSLAADCARQILDKQVVQGLIVSGDSFLNDPERVAAIRKRFPALCAAEMEAAAIGHTCYQFKIPFVVIRSLSDIAGKDAHISFDKFLPLAAKNAADLITLMLAKLRKGPAS